MIDYRDRECCLTCQGFAFWDGDYCCIRKWKIHQYGYGHENGGFFAYPWMNEDIDNTMKTPETCKDYKKNNSKYQLYTSEYKKFKQFQELQEQYDKVIK